MTRNSFIKLSILALSIWRWNSRSLPSLSRARFRWSWKMFTRPAMIPIPAKFRVYRFARVNGKCTAGDFLGLVGLTNILRYALDLKSFSLSDRFFAELWTPTRSDTNWKTQNWGHTSFWASAKADRAQIWFHCCRTHDNTFCKKIIIL